jgi:uridine kinase/phosphoglycolate phosphatase-like HAD superfamily hydrolase
MKRVVFEKSCLFAEEAGLADHKLHNVGKIIVSEKKDRRNVYFNDRDLRPGVIEVLDLLSVSGFSLVFVSELGIRETRIKLEDAMIDRYFERSISPKTSESYFKDYTKADSAEDYTVVVCRSEELIQAALKHRIPTIRVLGDGITDKGAATLFADNIEQVDDIVFQAQVFDEITRKIRSFEQCRLIGVDGIELVGKSYFSKKLSAFLAMYGIRTTVVRLTDFKSPIEVTYQGEDEVEAFYFHAFNYNKLLNELLLPFIEKGSVDVVLTSFGDETNRYGKDIHYKIDPGEAIILEGELMFREPLIDHFDCMIYLYMDDQEAMHRALVRDLFLGEETKEAEFKNKRIPAQKMYMARHVPVERCDFAVDNTNHRRPLILRDPGVG